jgi:hypothetical protein
MKDDNEALTFGRTLIRELMRKRPEEYASAAMEINDGKRSVDRIPFDFETRPPSHLPKRHNLRLA